MKADLNLLESYRISNRRSASKSNVLYTVLALIVVMIALIIVATGALLILNIKDNNQINALSADIMTLKQDANKVDIVNKELAAIDKTKNAFTMVNNEITADRMMNKKEISTVLSSLTTDVTVESIIYSRSIMVLKCKTTNKHSPSQTADNLDSKGISTTVQYTGFQSKEKTVKINENAEIPEGAITYEFTLTCYITPEQGGEAA